MSINEKLNNVMEEINDMFCKESLRNFTSSKQVYDPDVLKGQALVSELANVAFDLIEEVEHLKDELLDMRKEIEGIKKLKNQYKEA